MLVLWWCLIGVVLVVEPVGVLALSGRVAVRRIVLERVCVRFGGRVVSLFGLDCCQILVVRSEIVNCDVAASKGPCAVK